MDKSLFFITMTLVCVWLVVDDFVGQKRLSTLAGMVAPTWTPFTPVQDALDKAKDKVGELNDNYDKNREENPNYWDKLADDVIKKDPNKEHEA